MGSILATPTTPSPGDLAVANNLRVLSMSIAAYDYIVTIPWEYRLYRSSDQGRLRLGPILFILIRYISATLLIVSNVGFFYHGFSPESCGHYFYVILIVKLIQVMVLQAIFGIRTYNIARRNVWVGRIILMAYFIVVVFQLITDLFNQSPVMSDRNCMVSNAKPRSIISIWTFYLITMLYDYLILSISTVYLLKMKFANLTRRATAAPQVVEILLYDGLGYFIVVTAVNMMNLIMHRGTRNSVQTAAASLGNAVTWIMSQRILIHPREARMEQEPMITPLAAPPSACLSGGTMGKVTVNQGYPTGFGDDLMGTKSDDHRQVPAKQAILVDTEPKICEVIKA